MDIQVGDRVMFKSVKSKEIITVIVTSAAFGDELLDKDYAEILKIERPKYEVIKEKKELLTDEEEEFLKDICKYYNITGIYFDGYAVRLYENCKTVFIFDYSKNLEFKKVKTQYVYTLEELGLE